MAIDYIALGQRISDFRNKHNFSQEELALHISFAICSLSIFLLIEIFLSSVFLQQKTPDNQGHPTHLFISRVLCWPSASIPCRVSPVVGNLSPRRGLTIYPRCGLDALPSITMCR